MECSACGGRGRVNAAGRVDADDSNTFDCDECLGVGDVYAEDCDCSFCENCRAAAESRA